MRYGFGQAKAAPIVCAADVINQLAHDSGDFEKGPEDGAQPALRLAAAIAGAWLAEGGDAGESEAC